MSQHTFTQRFARLLVPSLLFCLLLYAPSFAQTSSQDEASARRIVEKYFAAYEEKDLNDLFALWSEKSPNLAPRKKYFQESFPEAQKIEIKDLTIGKITLDGDKARVRLGVEINIIDAKSGKPTADSGKINRTLHLVKESGEWKIWQYGSSEDDLAKAFVEAKTEAERKQLFEADKELVTVALVQALLVQGTILRQQRKYSQALAHYERIGEIANQLGDKKGIVNILRGIGTVHQSQGNYTEAFEYYHKSLKIAEESGDKAGFGTTLNAIGNTHQVQSNYTQALEYYERSLKIAEETGNKVGLSFILFYLGNNHLAQCNYTQALEYYHRSMKFKEEINDQYGIAAILNNIGGIYQAQGNYIQALEYCHKSLKLVEKLGSKQGISSALVNIGNVHHSQGNHAQALEYYQRSLKIAEETGDKVGIRIALGNTGTAHQSQGNYTESLEYHHRCLKIAEETGNKAGISNALNNIGSVHQSQGNYTQALEYYHRSLKIAEEIGEKGGIGDTLNNIGSIHQLQGNHKQAVEFASRATDLAEQTGLPGLFRDSRIVAGQAYQALHQPQETKKAFTDAIFAIEEIRNQVVGNAQQQQQFFAGNLAPYYGMVRLLIEQNNNLGAFAFAERAKARALLDVLQTGKLSITKAMSPAEKQQEEKLTYELVSLNAQIYTEKLHAQPNQTRLNDLNARLQKARLDLEAFHTSLYAAHPELKTQRGQTQPITLAEAAGLIPDDKTALLEFIVDKDQTYLFALSKGAPQQVVDFQVYKIDIKQDELAKLCNQYRQQLADRRVSYHALATRLYDLLLNPARTHLAGKTNLVIIPDGVLWELPFQTLQPARSHFLIEDAAISYAPSLTVLQKMMQTRQKKGTPAAPTLLAVGNPIISKETSGRVKTVTMDEQLLPLPEAERQVRLLQRLYSPARSKVYIGQKADEARIKAEAGNARILQLATHGILNDASPMYSQIVLAQGEADANEDGLLEAWEIMNLELNADLVVLSACETARGKLGAGEGMIGLAWALFVAGSPATVVSQWKVESASTTELMVAFHRNLQAGRGRLSSKLSKAEAMRRAALKLMKTSAYSHPFYWAGFVVIGDAS
jgi:CHAT domain-containing protein/Tfp pilus assembly protein PilF